MAKKARRKRGANQGDGFSGATVAPLSVLNARRGRRDDLLSERQAASMLGIDVAELRKRRREGRIGYVSVDRKIYYRPGHIDCHVENLRIIAETPDPHEALQKIVFRAYERAIRPFMEQAMKPLSRTDGDGGN